MRLVTEKCETDAPYIDEYLPLRYLIEPDEWCVGKRQSKKKGLSAEEKRARMMQIFFETKDVFQLKDLEKIAPKEKGITAMSVKEVLQSLVDDGMVDCERIGTSNYYWAFPSKALHARKRKLEALESQLSEGSQKHANLQKSIEKAKIGRHETEERTMLAKELSSLRDQREQLKAEVEKYKECDPQVVEEMRQANKVAKEAANRWTANPPLACVCFLCWVSPGDPRLSEFNSLGGLNRWPHRRAR
ncbi:PREDICTED: meiotic nuclear division protein 1 homolog isoform X2 [Chinchilla lanigera]|uniref:meiotic nuclear division protein 1 homolog isoform X2 n=1 Tax=Chinchilla lanigera TaxID=34839 RepID=UPI00038EFB38|nr:PREDICTED: meiotic nuclear division protein 1 homolog isoform X2 [Chinchilla lanigera]